MADDSRLSDVKRQEQAARSQRLAKALRDNLYRRKAQLRERAEANRAPDGRDDGVAEDGGPAT